MTEIINLQNFVEISFNMIYNITNKFIMGEFVVSPISMIIADKSATFTATLVISGIVVVLGILILLIFVMFLFGVIVPKFDKKSKQRAERKASKKAAKVSDKNNGGNEMVKQTNPVQIIPAPAPAPVVEAGVSGEVVAAIAAAVTAYEGTGVVIRSIKRKNVGSRNPWAQAAIADNTRPF